MKYARYLPEQYRRESYEEITERNMEMHIKKCPHLEEEIREAYKYVFSRQVLPSMRSMQFGGKPIEIAPNRIFNCAFMPIDDLRSFSEAMFLLLGGTGVGFSVQKHHVEKLPEIRLPSGREKRFLVGDSIEGWADAVRVLLQSYFKGTSRIRFDFSDIRPKGARLVTSGGKAPGPQPLVECLVKIDGILNAKKDGDKLTPIECHDIMCHIADAVLAGGIRRAALISLFSADDDEMIACKTGNWWETNPQRGRANNSAVLLRHKVDKEYFMDLWTRIRESGSGEPGIYLNNDKDWGTNPCCVDGDTIITTSAGKMTMRELVEKVENGETISVLSYDEATCSVELQPVEEAAMTREDADVIMIETEDGQVLTLTPDHRVFTENRGYVEAAHLTEEDILLFVE
jgi:ribonucleoside-diphosphate reductase alpha chain